VRKRKEKIGKRKEGFAGQSVNGEKQKEREKRIEGRGRCGAKR
jgi:hypothetical protein